MKFVCAESENFDEKFNEIMLIRSTVFEREQGAIESEEIDRYDKETATEYLLIYDGESAIATGRIAVTDKGVKIGRIAVLKEYRGKGIGAILVNEMCERVAKKGAEFVLVDAQLHAIPFYERLGFAPTGDDEIIDRGIRHLPMIKRYEG